MADVDVDVYDGSEAEPLLAEVLPIYETVYAEPPYREGPADVAEFSDSWPRRTAAPGFRLVIARSKGLPVGFAFGHELSPGTNWWIGAVGPLDVDTKEWPGRTFALIELAVLVGHRRGGVASRLHRSLLDGVNVERVTLLVRPEPEVAPARAAYASWGYQHVGQVRPWPDAPTYDAMVLLLPKPT